jgi:bifunctional non-homologous end joining protein LigD
MLRAAAFIEPCLPSPADKPPSGSNWIHEIKHDGFRLMARRDPVGVRLLTRRGNDWSNRFPLVVEAMNHLKVRSCLIDGEVVCCDERGVAIFLDAPSAAERGPRVPVRLRPTRDGRP